MLPLFSVTLATCTTHPATPLDNWRFIYLHTLLVNFSNHFHHFLFPTTTVRRRHCRHHRPALAYPEPHVSLRAFSPSRPRAPPHSPSLPAHRAGNRCGRRTRLRPHWRPHQVLAPCTYQYAEQHRFGARAHSQRRGESRFPLCALHGTGSQCCYEVHSGETTSHGRGFDRERNLEG